MFDLFGTQKRTEEAQRVRERNCQLRDKVFEHILQGQNLMRELGVITTKEYYEWRLPFDLERYNLHPYAHK